MERCNRPAHRYYPGLYRVCPEHSHPNDSAEILCSNAIGPCDYPLDGRGAMRYDKRMRLGPVKGA